MKGGFAMGMASVRMKSTITLVTVTRDLWEKTAKQVHASRFSSSNDKTAKQVQLRLALAHPQIRHAADDVHCTVYFVHQLFL